MLQVEDALQPRWMFRVDTVQNVWQGCLADEHPVMGDESTRFRANHEAGPNPAGFSPQGAGSFVQNLMYGAFVCYVDTMPA